MAPEDLYPDLHPLAFAARDGSGSIYDVLPDIKTIMIRSDIDTPYRWIEHACGILRKPTRMQKLAG